VTMSSRVGERRHPQRGGSDPYCRGRYPVTLSLIGASGGAVRVRVALLAVRVRVRASKVRLGDRLLNGESQPGRVVMQVRSRGGEVLLSHGVAETRLTGDPLVWVLRNEPRVVEEELPDTIWRPRGPRRTQPWEVSE
jgi:hypothetical protein